MCNHVISAKQFTVDQITSLFKSAGEIRRFGSRAMSGKIMATLFYEPSTRTRLSFEAAMMRLGGNVISTENAKNFSSAVKGETIRDTVRVVSGYADLIVLRHPDNFAAESAAECSAVPVINAGSGDGEHPTQGLLDLYTVAEEKGRIGDLHYALVGDLLHGRTIHSLIYLLSHYKDVKITLVSPDYLRLPNNVINFIKETDISWTQTSSTDEMLDGSPDVVYVTRPQAERWRSGTGTERNDNLYRFGREEFARLKKDAVVLHPLPRTEELPADCDGLPQAKYFKQAENGLWVRAALVSSLFKSSS